MLKITKEGKSLIVQGVNHKHFPFNDTLTYPMNSVAMVIDKSDIITFKSAANGDVLFSSMIDAILINDAPVTKEDIKTKFDSVSNAPMGGGGGESGAVNSVNGFTGDVVLSASDVNAYSKKEIDAKGFLTSIPDNIATDEEVANAVADKITQNDLDTAISNVEKQIPSLNGYATQTWVGQQGFLTAVPEEYITDSELTKKNYATVDQLPSIEGLASEEWVNKQGFLKTVPDEYVTDSELTLKNYATKDELPDVSNLLPKAEAAETYQKKGNYATVDQLPSIEGLATEEWVTNKNYLTSIPEEYLTESELARKNYVVQSQLETLATKDELKSKQDILVGSQTEGQNIKTINGQTLLGEGNIEITAGGGGGKVDSVNGQVGNVVLTAADLNAPTTEELNAALANKADASAITDMATKAWVNGEKFLKEVPSEYITETELSEKNYATKSEIPSVEGLASEQWVGEQGFLKAIPEEYAKKTDIDTAVADKVSTTALNEAIQGVEGKIPTVQTTIDGTDKNYVYSNPKDPKFTIKSFDSIFENPKVGFEQGYPLGYNTREWGSNGGSVKSFIIPNATQSKCGVMSIADKIKLDSIPEGGGGGSITVDDNLNLDSINPVQNKIITAELNKKVESIELTQEEYDQLPTKDPNVMYVITNAPEVALKSDLANLANKEELNAKANTSDLTPINEAVEKVQVGVNSNYEEIQRLKTSKADASAIVDMATQSWVTEQINAAIAQVNEKITEINNKIV